MADLRLRLAQFLFHSGVFTPMGPEAVGALLDATSPVVAST